MSKKVNLFLSLCSCILLLISFYFLPYAIFVSFIPILFATYNSKSSFRYGFFCGFLFGAGLLYWILALEAPIRLWLYLGFFLLLIYWGLIFGFSFWFTSNFYLFPLFPVIWTSIEFLRSLSTELGFSWGSIGYSLVDCLPLIQIVDILGLPGLAFFITLINLLIFYTIKKRNRLYSYLAGFFIVIVLIYGVFRLNEKTAGKKIIVGIVQPNTPHNIKREGNFDFRFSLLYKLSKKLTSCDLIVWPESALPGYIDAPDIKEQICKIIDSLQTSLVLGGGRIDLANDKIFNSAFLFSPNGYRGFYDKIYLVPFGERLPFDRYFPVLQKLNFGQGNFSPGKTYKVFNLNGGAYFSVLICFESIFPRVSRRFIRNGAEFLVNITDDSWFGRTHGPYQHAEQAILRAVEYRVPIVRCGSSGISFFVTKKGEVKHKTEIFTQTTIKDEIELREGHTFYSKYGDWFAWLCVSIFFIFFSLRITKKWS